jgi:hypothetical protein
MIVIGVDPGKVTGLAVWCDHRCGSAWHTYAPDTLEVEDSTVVAAMLRRMLGEHAGRHPDLMAIERFVQGSRKTHQPHAQRVTGAVAELATELDVKLVYQSPSPALKIAPNALLRRIGWYVPTRDQHANSAQRQVLLVLATFFPETFATLVGI